MTSATLEAFLQLDESRLIRDFDPVTLWRCKKCGVIVGKEESTPFHKCKEPFLRKAFTENMEARK